MRKFIALLLLIGLGTAHADFDRGMTAYFERNFDTAFAEFMDAARDGHAMAQFNVGVMYYRGQGVPKDMTQAYAWIELSTQNGARENIDAQEVLTLAMDTDQLRAGHIAAARLAREHGLRYETPKAQYLEDLLVVAQNN